MRFFTHTLVAGIVLSISLAHAAGPTGLLNDTGQISCYDGTNAAVACSSSGVGSDAGTNPRQDARFGRDAAQAAGQLPAKTGGGAAGFDFTKVCMSGELAGQGSCPANPVQGTNPNEWACTKDNVTNLIWSIESFSNQTWLQAIGTGAGTLIGGYNANTRCGFATAWRAPTTRELLSIVHRGVGSPAIDTAYFPGTASNYYWSNDVYAPSPADAWLVGFDVGYTYALNKTHTSYVRLVRSGQ